MAATTTIIATRRTYPGNRWDWVRTRFATLVQLLQDRGLPLDTAMPVALALLAHLIRETGWGRSEWNNSPGNIKCRGSFAPADEPGWHGQCHVLQVSTRRLLRESGVTAAEALELSQGPTRAEQYRSYATLYDGLADYLRLLESRTYRGALRHLIEHPEDGVGFYDRLMRSGYHPWSAEALREFARIVANVHQLAQRAQSGAAA